MSFLMLRVLRKKDLTRWIMLAMVLGVLAGWLFPEGSQHLGLISNVFLRMIKSIIVPLLFSTLVLGVAGHGDDLKAVGRLALKSIVYFEVVTTLALLIGLAAVNLLRPGEGVSLPNSTTPGLESSGRDLSLQSTIEHLVPSSIVEAAAHNEVLQVVFFALLFAVALTQVHGKPKETILGLCEGLAEVMFKVTGIVMKLAPLAIGAALACVVGQNGLGVLLNLGKVLLTFYGALLVFLVMVLVPIMWTARIPIKGFIRAVREPALIAFSTSSSEAALPDAFKQMRNFGVPNRIVSFVLPTGYSFNLDGSTLYLSVALIFVAQAAGIRLTLPQQLLMMLTLMLTSKGTAGVPRASLVVLSGAVVGFRLPLEGVALLLGVDQLMDMARTMVNVIGNCLASAAMARWEGEFTPGNPGDLSSGPGQLPEEPATRSSEPEPPVAQPRMLGIFGGMGPEATANLYQEILKCTPATKDQEHIPTLIYSLPQVPDRTAAIQSQDCSIIPYLVDGVRRLQDAGATFIVIPCNTAHYFFEAMQEAVEIPILHMIRETVDQVARCHPACRRVGLLATTGTIASGLYEQQFRAHNLAVLYPDETMQADCVMKAVYGIKNGGEKPASEELLHTAGASLIQKGAEVLVLGCTEIPLAFNAHRVSVPVVNATRVLAEAAVREFYRLSCQA